MNKKIKVSIAIVNFRTHQFTINCLDSLFEIIQKGARINVIVADNNSQDGSEEAIANVILHRGWTAWVSLLPLEKNGGFSYGNNKIIEKLLEGLDLPDYIWLLNPDTVVHIDACRALSDFLAGHPEVGIVGSHLKALDGSPQNSAFRDHTVMSEFLSAMRLGVLDKVFSRWLVATPNIAENSHQTGWVSGASMMVRREVFEEIGLLDDNFFMYFEEVDFILRARKKGWSCWYVPESRVVHIVGAASGISSTKKESVRRPAYWFKSRRRFFLKNYGWLVLLLADSAWLIGYCLWRFRRMLQNKPDLDPPCFLKDFFRQSCFVKGFTI